MAGADYASKYTRPNMPRQTAAPTTKNATTSAAVHSVVSGEPVRSRLPQHASYGVMTEVL